MNETKYSDKLIERVSREIHWYLAYATVSVYYIMTKALDTNKSDEEREKSLETLNQMMTTAESLYEDLSDKQKELMKDLALTMINIVKNN